MITKWDIDHVYFYLVSFIALILIIIGGVNLTRTTISILAPIDDSYNPYTDAYQRTDLETWVDEFGEEFLEREKARFALIERENQRRRLIRELAGSLSFIVASLPVYYFHWRLIKNNGIASP